MDNIWISRHYLLSAESVSLLSPPRLRWWTPGPALGSSGGGDTVHRYTAPLLCSVSGGDHNTQHTTNTTHTTQHCTIKTLLHTGSHRNSDILMIKEGDWSSDNEDT